MSFGQGLSGLSAAAQELDVIGNNIANAGTVGFKASSASFADVYAQSRVGLGVQLSAVKQRFTVGNVNATGNPYDMAIDGERGLFRITDPNGRVLYTRNGQFGEDKDHYIVNAQGCRLTGYAPGSTDLIPLKRPTENIAPVATTRVDNHVTFDANAKVVEASVAFDPANNDTYASKTSITVFDSMGNLHTLEQYYTKRPEANGESVWEVNVRVDGKAPDTGAVATYRFDKSGRLLGDATGNTSHALSLANPGAAGSPAEPLSITLDFSDAKQFGGKFNNNVTLDGNATGEYTTLSIDADGSIVANYSNGARQTIGTIALADFNNLQGLKPVGGNAWEETSASGQPMLGTPGSNGLALLKGQAVEASNVDMSQELVNMIVAQRSYQANAQTIKTQDQVLQTLMTMR